MLAIQISVVSPTRLRKERLTRTLLQTEAFMVKALQGEAVVRLPQALNNAGHGSLRLARRVKSFQAVLQINNMTNCILAEKTRINIIAPILLLLS